MRSLTKSWRRSVARACAAWRLTEESGHALLMTFAVLVLLMPVGAFVLRQVEIDLLLHRNARGEMELFYAAEAGLELARADLDSAPMFERLARSGQRSGGADVPFPFAHEPPPFFPRAPYRYEVRIRRRGSDRVDLISRSFGSGSSMQEVALSVLRSPSAYVPGAVALSSPGPAISLGTQFRISGMDRGHQEDAIPALAVPGEEAARQVAAGLHPSDHGRLIGRGRAPSVAAGQIPDLSTWRAALEGAPGARFLEPELSGSLGEGVFVRRGSLDVTNAAASGALLVEGQMRVNGRFVFSGLLVVLGDLLLAPDGHLEVYGAAAQGNPGRMLDLRGSGGITYDSRPIARLDSQVPNLLPHGIRIGGWRQVF